MRGRKICTGTLISQRSIKATSYHTKLEEAKAFAEKINSAAVMVLYDGKVFISWGNVATKYKIHSIRTPLLSALYGIYKGRGKINLDATLEELGIDDIPPRSQRKRKRLP